MTQKLLKRLVQLPLTRLGCSLQKVGAKVHERERTEETGISYKAVLTFRLNVLSFVSAIVLWWFFRPLVNASSVWGDWCWGLCPGKGISGNQCRFYRKHWVSTGGASNAWHSQLCINHHNSQMSLFGFALKRKHCWVHRRRQSCDPTGDSPASTLRPSLWSHPEHFQIWTYSKNWMIFLTLESVATYRGKRNQIRWNCPHIFWQFGEFPSVSHLHQQQTSASRPCRQGSSQAWNGNIAYGNRHLQDFLHEHELLFSEL